MAADKEAIRLVSFQSILIFPTGLVPYDTACQMLDMRRRRLISMQVAGDTTIMRLRHTCVSMATCQGDGW